MLTLDNLIEVGDEYKVNGEEKLNIKKSLEFKI